jgi:high-affinity Fe2+/Pb2+ permease
MEAYDSALTSFVIWFREGVEVLLILYAMNAIAKRPFPIVVGGVAGIAVVVAIGVIVGCCPHNVVADNAIMLAAAALMLYVARGFLMWQFSGEAKKALLQARALRFASNPFALGALAMAMVGREVLELFVFTEALTIRTGGWTSWVFGGIGVAAVCVLVVYFMLDRVASWLSLKWLFAVSSAWLIVQAGLLIWEVVT